jgi:hypothetical protein
MISRTFTDGRSLMRPYTAIVYVTPGCRVLAGIRIAVGSFVTNDANDTEPSACRVVELSMDSGATYELSTTAAS